MTYGFSVEEPKKIGCEVLGEPNILQYKWKLNTTSDNSSNIKLSAWLNKQHKASILYQPRLFDLDFLTLFCWGENIIGIQDEPCEIMLYKTSK